MVVISLAFFFIGIYYLRYFTSIKKLLSLRTKESLLPKYLYFQVDVDGVECNEDVFDCEKTHDLSIKLYKAFRPEWPRADAFISDIFEDVDVEINRDTDMDIADSIIDLVKNTLDVRTIPVFVYKDSFKLRYMKVLIKSFDIDNRTDRLIHIDETYMNGCLEYIMKEYALIQSVNDVNDVNDENDENDVNDVNGMEKKDEKWNVIYNNDMILYEYSQLDSFVNLLS